VSADPTTDEHSDPTCGAEHCITCGDDGEPMTVIAVDGSRGLALCAGDEGSHSTVEIALVEPVVTGDRLLVHAGTAIARISQEEGGEEEGGDEGDLRTLVGGGLA
jgi:hydrogenase maturation factor